MVDFIDRHRAEYGVEPICRELPIAPSTYHAAKACQADPACRSARARHDEALCVEIQRIFDDNFGVYGVRKVWEQLKREGYAVARCVATWRGFAYTAFVIDTFDDRIVGWRTSHSMRAGLVLDALEQALAARSTDDSDRGTQYVSIRYTERLRQVGIGPSVGSTGDSYDNALAESIIGLYKTEVIHRRGPWRTLSDVEYATLEWVGWFNNRRLLSSIGYVPPVEFEHAYYRKNEGQALAA
ncbi:MAG: IS3 family transposase [Wenzhouxiangellaceae bacterium]|nr:IS3 family transposase [Wenzhouxiangellaceae bacterium]